MGERIYSKEKLALEIIVKFQKGCSYRAIARQLQVGRKVVTGVVRRYQQQRESGHNGLDGVARSKRKSKLDVWLPEIRRLLEEFPDITAVRMHEELQTLGYVGGQTIVRDKLREIRPRSKKEAVIRFETSPGQQGQMDWSPYTINFTKDGRKQVLCFSYILGYSRRQYIDFTTRRDFHTLIRRHKDAFRYFQGVPEHCLYDNEKTVSLRWEAGKPVYNPAFLSFCFHYGTRPVACRRWRPQTKGKVEEPFQYVVSNLFNGRTFRDLDDLRQTARWWLENRSDVHRHATTQRPPIELFLEHEKAALLPLPNADYDSSEVVHRVGYLDGTVRFRGNIYSIPFSHIGLILVVKAEEEEIRIFNPELEEIAVHKRLSDGGGRKTELTEHRLSQKDRYGVEPYRETFLALGNVAQTYLAGLQQSGPRCAGLCVRQILAFKEIYHSGDINRALAHALRYHAYEVKAIKNILEAKARPRTLESTSVGQFHKALSGQLPQIQQRSLTHYALLDKEDKS